MTRTGGTDWGDWLADRDGRDGEFDAFAPALTADAAVAVDNVRKLSDGRVSDYVPVLEASPRESFGDGVEGVEVVPGRAAGAGTPLPTSETGDRPFPVAVRVEADGEEVAHHEAFVPIPPGVAAPLVEGVLFVVGVAGTTAVRTAAEDVGAAVVERLRERLLTVEEREATERRNRERERAYGDDYGFEE